MIDNNNNLKKKIVAGYARCSTPRQQISRQISNLKAAYPDIVIIAEVYSAKTDNRPKWQKLLRQCRAGVVGKIVFDEVSRMSRDAESGVATYKELYNLGIELEFLKEPHINSSVYRESSKNGIEVDTQMMDKETAELISTVIAGLNDYLLAVAEKQIYLAFLHGQKERELLSRRTSEGLKQTVILNGKVLGRKKNSHIETKKAKRAKRIIKKYYKLLGGPLNVEECCKVAQITKTTFYRYINQMREEDKANGVLWPDENIAEKIDSKDSLMTEDEISNVIKEYDKQYREHLM